MNIKKSIGIIAASAMILAASTVEASIHRRGCEVPLDGVRVCWEATGPEGSAPGPYPEVHLLAVAQNRAGEKEVLTSYTRDLFRQLLPSNLTQNLILEWDSALYLDQALATVRGKGWPAALWISPRQLRNSGAATAGVVDWDVYLIDGGSTALIRTLRIRVESHPEIRRDDAEQALTMGGVLVTTGMAATNPMLAVTAVAAAASLAEHSPPEAGLPLAVMSQLAARQALFLFQYPLEALMGPPETPSRGVISAMTRPPNYVPAPGLAPAAGEQAVEKNWLDRLLESW